MLLKHGAIYKDDDEEYYTVNMQKVYYILYNIYKAKEVHEVNIDFKKGIVRAIILY